MKKIFFVRHAKSDWSISGQADIDRPLNQRGYSDAHRMGQYLKQHVSGSTLFVTSSAIRAISTALIVARETGYPENKIVIHPPLYEAETRNYGTLIDSIDDKFGSVFVFGHNPTISEVISVCSRKDVGEVPTCAVFCLSFGTESWEGTSGLIGKIELQLSPRSLSDSGN